MQDKVVVDLGAVQKTLFLPLWGRAMETRRKDPMLEDPAAVRVIESVDFDFPTITQNITEISQIAWIMRSIRVDTVIAKVIAEDPRATIVNIGCGLDTTFDRVDNGQLTWYDLDLPDVIVLRRKFFEDSDRRRMIASSFLEESWMDAIAADGRVLFIAAGVFYYFEEEIISGFMKRLADRYPGGELLFDVCSPTGVRTANQMVIKRAGMDEGALMVWGLKHTDDILAWDDRIRLLDTITYFEDKRIGLKNRLMGYVSDLLRIQYMIHLRIADE